LFRQRRIKALQRLNKKEEELDSVLDNDELEDFDADKFFGIKEENFETGLSIP